MKEEIQFKIRVPRAITNVWDRRSEVGHVLLKQLVPNVGSVVLALVLFWVAAANAAPWNVPAQSITNVPLTVNYQGRLADAAGNPIDNTNPGLGMTFALYDTDTGGTPLWTETHANVPVSEGLFSVRLGSINPLSVDLLNGNRWLGIQVGTDPEMTPREPLDTVPYALQADTARRALNVAVGSGTITRDEQIPVPTYPDGTQASLEQCEWLVSPQSWNWPDTNCTDNHGIMGETVEMAADGTVTGWRDVTPWNNCNTSERHFAAYNYLVVCTR